MDPDAQLLATFGDGALVRGNEAFFDAVTAQKAIDYCEEHGLAVSGMEGVLIEDDGLRPLLDCLADFSEHPGASWTETVKPWDQAARRVLDQWAVEHPGLRVSMTVLSEEDWPGMCGTRTS